MLVTTNPTADKSIKGFLQTIQHHKDRMLDPASPDAVVSPDTTTPGLFFITETFNDLPNATSNEPLYSHKPAFAYHDKNDLIDLTHKRHAKFYKHILNQSVPSNHFPQRKKLYPVALSFIDLSGSRQHRPNTLKVPHVHSVFVVPPKTLPRFKKLIKDEFRLSPESSKTHHIKSVDCQRMLWDWREIEKVVSYSAKFYLGEYAKSFSEDTKSLIFSIHG